MAEPTNTPFPPGTPVPASRSASPAPPLPSISPTATSYPLRPTSSSRKPVVLHIGDPIRYNPATYAAFSAAFDIVRPSTAERQRPEFIRALTDRRWGDFSAIFRPFWGTGGEMGRWDEELIGLLPDSVRIFASAGAGFDWADTELLGQRGIIYCNSGLAAAEAVADFAVAMIISTFRQLPWCMAAATLPYLSSSDDDATAEEVAHGFFQSCHAFATGQSRNPRNHVLGLIGLGNIGQHVAAKMGNPAFGMKIHYFDVFRKSAAVEAELGATFHPSLEALLQVADCIVLCTPASTDGRPLITRETLSHMRPGTRFVNIARGSLVDADALADALEAGTVWAAALDVHADEPRINRRLLRMSGIELAVDGAPKGDVPRVHPGRVMLTCHNAGGTVDSHIGFEELSMRNIMTFLSSGEAITPVNMHYLKRKEQIDPLKNRM